MAKRPKSGDVLELTTPSGRIYLHYLGKHVDYGEGVAVCTAIHPATPPIGPDLFLDGYVTFYPVVAAAARGLAAVVGHLPSSGLPTRLRRPGARLGGEVRSWIIEDPSGEVVKQRLSAEELRLPIAVIWNQALLTQRVAEGWRPEMDGSHE